MDRPEDKLQDPLQWIDRSGEATEKHGVVFEEYWIAHGAFGEPFCYVIKRRRNAACSTLIITVSRTSAEDLVVRKQDFPNAEGAMDSARNWLTRRINMTWRTRLPYGDLE